MFKRVPEATLAKTPPSAPVVVSSVNVFAPVTEPWNPLAKESTRLPPSVTAPFTLMKPYCDPWASPPSWKESCEPESNETLPVTAKPAPPRSGRIIALFVMPAVIDPNPESSPPWKTSALLDCTVPPASWNEPAVWV